jgi:hypothetical protein
MSVNERSQGNTPVGTVTTTGSVTQITILVGGGVDNEWCSAVSSGNGDIHITNSCEGKLGSELIIDDFKISTGGGESQVSSNICIGSTESANQKVGTRDMDITITARDGTQSIDETFDIKVVDGSQFLLSEITNANISGIGSTESANQKVGTLVIGKNDLIIDKEGVVNLDISWSFL